MRMYRVNEGVVIDLDKIYFVYRIKNSKKYKIVFGYSISIEINEKEYCNMLEVLGDVANG